MTLQERADSYNRTFPDRPPLIAWRERWLYGIWEVGNNYQNRTSYYGAYPPTYVERVESVFPDKDPAKTLHLFSGSLQGPGVRLDLLANQTVTPTVQGSAERLPFRDRSFNFVMADPSYSKEDSQRYGAPHPNKRRVLRDLARVVAPGGHVVWLDIPKPQYRKDEWRLFGEVGVLRSTNHRGRFCFMFERM